MSVAAAIDLNLLKTELDEYGFVILNNLIPADEARGMADRLMEIMLQQPDAEKPVQNLRGVFNYLAPSDYELFCTLVTNPTYQALARNKLGEGFQMAEVGCIWVKPGGGPGRLHADVPIGWFPRNSMPIPNVCFMVNCIWMLTDFTREDGGTLLLPFTHHSRQVPRPDVEYRHLLSAEGEAGSIVIFDGRIWHATGANVTNDRQRVGLSSGFHTAWMDPAAGNWHLMKRSVLDRLPAEVQEMNKHVVEG